MVIAMVGTSREDAEKNKPLYQAASFQTGYCLARIESPTLVVRGAASDILSPEVADRMVDDVLQQGQLAIVGQAGHSVMTDNPEGFRDAVAAFVLSE